jgi:hypothetical protein
LTFCFPFLLFPFSFTLYHYRSCLSPWICFASRTMPMPLLTTNPQALLC